MPKITLIKPQRSKKRVNIYLDGKFAFGLDLENFVKTGLKVEQELSQDEVTQIIEDSEFQKILDALLKFASLRPRSEREIGDYFRRKKVHKSIQEKLTARLKKLDMIDDLKFAYWWVDQRQQFRPKPKMILKRELMLKGIKRENIDRVLDDIKVDEEKIARDLLEKKKYRWKNMGKGEARRKMSEFLSRKGFAWDVIKKAVGVGDY